MRSFSCPSCKKAVSWDNNVWRPFCSEACKNRDLGRWATEDYKIASAEEDPVPGEESSEEE